MKGKIVPAYLMFGITVVVLAFFVSLSFAGAGITLAAVSPSPANLSNYSTDGNDGYFNVNFTSNESLISIPILKVYNISGDGNSGDFPMVVNGTDATAHYASFNVTGLGNGTFEWVVTGINTSSLGANQTLGNYTVTLGQIYDYIISNPVNNTNTTDFTPEIKVSANSTFLTNISLTFYTNKGGTVQAIIDTSILNGTETSFNMTALGNGTYDIIVEFGDSADLLFNASARRLNIDTDPPVVSITYPVNNTNTTDQTPEIRISANDTEDTNLTLTIYVRRGNTSEVILSHNTTILNGTETHFNLSGTDLRHGTWYVTAEVVDDVFVPQSTNSSTVLINISSFTYTLISPLNGTNTSDTTPEIVVQANSSQYGNITIQVFSDSGTTRIVTLNTTILNNTKTLFNITLTNNARHNITIEFSNGADIRRNMTIVNLLVDGTGPTYNNVASLNYTNWNGTDMTGNISIVYSDALSFVDGCSITIYGTQGTRVYNSSSATFNETASANRTCSFDITSDMVHGEGAFKVETRVNDSANSVSSALNYSNWTKVTLVANSWNLIMAQHNTTLGGIGNYSYYITHVSIYNNTAGNYTSWIKGTATGQATKVREGDAIYVYVNSTANLIRYVGLGDTTVSYNLSNITNGGWNQVGFFNNTIRLMDFCNEKTGDKYWTFPAANESKYYSHRCGFTYWNETSVPKGRAVWVNMMNITANYEITKPVGD